MSLSVPKFLNFDPELEWALAVKKAQWLRSHLMRTIAIAKHYRQDRDYWKQTRHECDAALLETEREARQLREALRQIVTVWEYMNDDVGKGIEAAHDMKNIAKGALKATPPTAGAGRSEG